MDFSPTVGFRVKGQIALDGGKGLPVDNGLVSALYPIPLVLGNVDQDIGLVADFFATALYHGACVHFVVEDAPDGGFVPETVVVFRGIAASPAVVGFVAGRTGNTAFIQHMGDVLFAVALQGPLEDLADHLGSFGINDDAVFVGGVLFVAVDGESADVLTLPALQVEDHADVLGKVLQVPLVD